MRIKLLVFGTILGLIWACSDDDSFATLSPDSVKEPSPEPENNSPGAFNLIAPIAHADREILLPKFVWETATDPDGDAITYDLYIDQETDPQMRLATSMVDTTFAPTANLELFATYFWKVVARDTKGNEKTSTIQSFETKPKLFCNEYNFNGKTVQIEYGAPGVIDKINDLNSEQNFIFYNAEGKLSKQINRFENIDYEYDSEGRLNIIKKLATTSGEETIINFSYIDLNRVQRIEKRQVGSNTVREISFSYLEGESLPLGLMSSVGNDLGNGNYDILYQDRCFFTWDEHENLVEILVEHDYPFGSGFEFKSLTKLEYDTMQNPAYDITREGFGFNNFFVKHEHNYNFASLFLIDNLKWISKNNILTNEHRYVNTSFLNVSTRSMIYDYNESGYPISAIVHQTFNDLPPKFYERSWKYEQP